MPLLAEHKFGWHTHVLAFCRLTRKQFSVIVINFNDVPVHAYISLKPLQQYFPNFEDSDIVVDMEDWVGEDRKNKRLEDGLPDESRYFLGEILNERLHISLHNMTSHIWGFYLRGNDKTT